MPGELSGAYSQRSVYGAFLLSPQAGGYVLAAVIAFVIGVVFTLLCQRYRKKSSPGIRALSGLEKRGHFSDRILFSVTGGTMEEGSSEVRTQEGTCPYCRKNTRYKVTVTRYTENGPREDTYYECVRCGREERPVI
ncbi:MAG: hypothetical protein K5770_06160 [Lachnospiraceae bacterium]|nr:hypothetical protein [Lachnospiraceae bacterium]